MTQSDLAHRFTAGTTKGQASNMFIDGDTIYSYGYHFPIARRLGPGEFLYNDSYYSITTRKHQHRVYHAISFSSAHIYDVPDLKIDSVAACYTRRVNNLITKIKRSRTLGARYINQYYKIGEYWNMLKKRFNLSSVKLDRLINPNHDEALILKMVEIEFKRR